MRAAALRRPEPLGSPPASAAAWAPAGARLLGSPAQLRLRLPEPEPQPEPEPEREREQPDPELQEELRALEVEELLRDVEHGEDFRCAPCCCESGVRCLRCCSLRPLAAVSPSVAD